MERFAAIGSVIAIILIPVLSRVTQSHQSLTFSAFLLFGVGCAAIGVAVGKLSCEKELSSLRDFKARSKEKDV